MKMYGVFAKPQLPKEQPANMSEVETAKMMAVAVAESDKNPVALCRYADQAQTILKGYDNGAMEIREVDVTAFEVVTRRPVAL